MQWSPDRNAGFSRADPQRLYLPPIMDPVYGFGAVNVEAQSRDPSSLLNWMRRLLAIRKSSKVFGRGRLQFLEPGNRKVLAYIRAYEMETVLCVANLSRSAQPVELDLSAYKGRVPVELIGRTPFPPIGELPYLLTLHGHGFYWFRLAEGGDVPVWHEERLAPEELPLLVLFDGWRSLFRDRVVPWRMAMADKVRAQWEGEALPRFMETQRWYAEKGRGLKEAVMIETAEWNDPVCHWFLTVVETRGETGSARYFLPLSLIWENESESRLRSVLPFAVARVRQQATLGVLGDAFADDGFCHALVEAIRTGAQFEGQGGVIRGRPVGAEPLGDFADEPVHRPSRHSSNTSVAIGDRLFLKGYRHIQKGVNPEAEMGRYLSEVVHFPHTVPVLGTLEYQDEHGDVMTLALLQAYVENQGDGWGYALNYLESHLELCLTATSADAVEGGEEAHGGYLALMRVLGKRTAELHSSLARSMGDPAFDPEPISPTDCEGWLARMREEMETTFDSLVSRGQTLPLEALSDREAVLGLRAQLTNQLVQPVRRTLQGLKTRYHGDYHLGQVLLRNNDFAITDFEGEPSRPVAVRRQKHTPLRDVAGMLRSFNYVMYTALDHVTMARNEQMADLLPHARAWERAVSEAFLTSYAAHTRGARLWNDLSGMREWLDLFVLEKALYELRYEMDNRPQSVSIPLRGLLQYGEPRSTEAGSPGA